MTRASNPVAVMRTQALVGILALCYCLLTLVWSHGTGLSEVQPPGGQDGGTVVLADARPAPARWQLMKVASYEQRLKTGALVFNRHGEAAIVSAPHMATVHLTYASQSMLPFVRNWVHHVRAAQLTPFLVGTVDATLWQVCSDEEVPAAGLSTLFDMRTHRSSRPPDGTENASQVQTFGSGSSYSRVSGRSFNWMGLAKVTFVLLLLDLPDRKFNVLVSDLDVLWIPPQPPYGDWSSWMVGSDSAHGENTTSQTPLRREAQLLAKADVLVTTDALSDDSMDLDRDPGAGGRPGWGMGFELNTGVMFWRNLLGARGLLHQWRAAMVAALDEATIEQYVFISLVRQARLSSVGWQPQLWSKWAEALRPQGLALPHAPRMGPAVRDAFLSDARYSPCGAEAEAATGDGACAPLPFALGTLPPLSFMGGHTAFLQGRLAAALPGMAQSGRTRPHSVHLTHQFSDAADFPYGKRHRAREALLWAIDPPTYFDGHFVRLVGPLYSRSEWGRIAAAFPEGSPQRHLRLDALQRSAVRDLLALSKALNFTPVMPVLHCACDRTWFVLRGCRHPDAETDAPLPSPCPMDALFDVSRWHRAGLDFRESSFFDNPKKLSRVLDAVVRVSVGRGDATAGTPGAEFSAALPRGARLADVAAVARSKLRAVAVVEISAADLKLLCRTLGSAEADRAFDDQMRSVLSDSASFCTAEDNPAFHGYREWNSRADQKQQLNCSYGFLPPLGLAGADGAPGCDGRI